MTVAEESLNAADRYREAIIEYRINNGIPQRFQGSAEAVMQAHSKDCEDRRRPVAARSHRRSGPRSCGARLAKRASVWFQTCSSGLSSGA